MCGHAGFARHPQAKGFKAAKRALNDMIKGIEHRGRHATGFAAIGGSADFIFKIAMPIGQLQNSGRWQSEMDKIAPDTRVVMGHTRWATLPNAHVDSAAHPFRFGGTVGAHNGQIQNWRDLMSKTTEKWQVDSEAAFYLLEQNEDAREALKQLSGNFALAWTKGGKLHFARNQNPLVFAYVRKFQTLFWCSEREPMVKALRGAGITTKQMEVYHPAAMTIYSYDTDLFDTNGSHAERMLFEGPAVVATVSSKASARPVHWSAQGEPEPYDQWLERVRQRDKSEQGELPLRTKKTKAKTGSLAEMLDNMQSQIEQQNVLIRKLIERMQSMDAELESAQAEISHLFMVIDSAGLLNGDFEAEAIRSMQEDELPEGLSESAPF